MVQRDVFDDLVSVNADSIVSKTIPHDTRELQNDNPGTMDVHTSQGRLLTHRTGESKRLKHTQDRLPSKFEQSILPMVLPSHGFTTTSTKSAHKLYYDWYPKWICARLAHLPEKMLHSIQDIPLVFEEVALGAKNKESLDTIAQTLLERGLVLPSSNVNGKALAIATAFTLLGLQSMLYEADTTDITETIAITDILDGYRSIAFFRLRPNHPQFESTLADLLLGFGLMLPKAELCISEELEDIEAFENVKIVTPGCLNAAALSSLGQFQFKWVDTIAPHLELDKATNTIFLYRWPSFCLANLCIAPEHLPDGILHRYGMYHIPQMSEILTRTYSLASHTETPGSWACPEEVTKLLQEIILSFRLLFGQDQRSRKFFRKEMVKDQTSSHGVDAFLLDLCTSARRSPETIGQDKECYRLARDFPVLRERIAILQQQLTHVRPRGWRAIWRDRRDSAQWYTFWAVIMFGSVATFLAIAQTALQGIQTFGHGRR